MGKTSTLDVPITEDEFNRINAGEHVQVVVPHLSADMREFLISGITPEDWDKMFN